MRNLIALPVVTALLLPATAQAMTVKEFLAKTDALKAQGLLAMTSPDIGLLRDEIKSAGATYRAGLAREIAAGRKPSSCPPPVGQVKMTSDDIIKEFRAIPEAKRNQSVTNAWATIMTRRHPCR